MPPLNDILHHLLRLLQVIRQHRLVHLILPQLLVMCGSRVLDAFVGGFGGLVGGIEGGLARFAGRRGDGDGDC
jgi:hypothetical protein